MEMTMLKAYAALQLVPAFLAHRWYLVLSALVAVALFGRRVYCRFVCPLGIVQSLLRVFRRRRRICSRFDAVVMHTDVRERPYQVAIRLAILFLFLLVGIVGWGWQWLDPYAIACRAVCWFTSPEFDPVVALCALAPVGVVLLLAVFFGGRIWCNWICPVGTLLAFVGLRPWKGDKVAKCAGCDKCRRCF